MRGKGILIDDSYELLIAPVLDSTGKIVSGLIVGNTLYQNQALILIFQPGAIKLSPVVGVGITDALLDNDFLAWRRKIRQQMELDGQTVRKVTFSDKQQLAIDASYSNG